MTNRSDTGKKAEELTANFLRRNGTAVIKRNYRSRYGEIDIIAETEEYIIFVEVRARASGNLVTGAESVTPKKQKRIILTAMDFLSRFYTEAQPRFDVAEVTVTGDGKGAHYSLNYIKNAFGI